MKKGREYNNGNGNKEGNLRVHLNLERMWLVGLIEHVLLLLLFFCSSDGGEDSSRVTLIYLQGAGKIEARLFYYYYIHFLVISPNKRGIFY